MMLKGRDIICISSIDWDFVWQGHQEIMSTFARNGNRILFIENTGVRSPRLGDIPRLKKRIINWFKSVKGFTTRMENLYIYSPVILPFPYSRIARWINKRIMIRAIKLWMKATGFHNPIIWTFLPTGTALDIIDNIDHDLLVYYCIADFYELVTQPAKVKRTEDALLKKCDIIFAQGAMLKERCERFNSNVHIFPFGVNLGTFEQFINAGNKALIPEDLKMIKGPIIGYVGGIHKHIDFGLLKYIAEIHPDWNIVLVGPIQIQPGGLDKLPNVFLLGKKDFSSLPAYINRFDVCVIPYELNNYTMTVFPTKLNEYHAMGKPVISTALPEVVRFNEENGELVTVCKAKEDFVNAIESKLQSKGDSMLEKARTASAATHEWGVRIAEMSRLISMEFSKKANAGADWREMLIKFYKKSRSRLLKIGVLAFVAYLLIWHTGFLWMIAKPLTCNGKLQKADAIAVFAGGVGESGKAAQGYEERVAYAVELYKKGLAGHLIFSSGYTYAFKEAFVMEALARSLGVPESVILLETKATNTYENVKLTSDIARKAGWKKVIVVSSPYNMKRAALVYAKVAPDIAFICAPVPFSLFYKDKKVELKHIQAILHEYIGIAYYKLKGYI